ncbi:hypothetical protein FA13DRAFT_1728847 [Coprinellus micaceus]|uniref:Uncharacterized protein n=1 Tax=Coprinellus micaceus TaxID=71717 RepID=A0A4Y7TDV5_COPMI|nr:hypothetical protein FA13DRAFT_1744500 [Coprinellus micaceus]TEB32320.1 hypothetical protein FA13DRAFT_1731505 [Coprinellus micaceus]TEB35055.1 hypothetical protein FA13DRAFT_1728847 [Coprinellus micaceus]
MTHHYTEIKHTVPVIFYFAGSGPVHCSKETIVASTHPERLCTSKEFGRTDACQGLEWRPPANTTV